MLDPVAQRIARAGLGQMLMAAHDLLHCPVADCMHRSLQACFPSRAQKRKQPLIVHIAGAGVAGRVRVGLAERGGARTERSVNQQAPSGLLEPEPTRHLRVPGLKVGDGSDFTGGQPIEERAPFIIGRVLDADQRSDHRYAFDRSLPAGKLKRLAHGLRGQPVFEHPRDPLVGLATQHPGRPAVAVPVHASGLHARPDRQNQLQPGGIGHRRMAVNTIDEDRHVGNHLVKLSPLRVAVLLQPVRLKIEPQHHSSLQRILPAVAQALLHLCDRAHSSHVRKERLQPGFERMRVRVNQARQDNTGKGSRDQGVKGSSVRHFVPVSLHPYVPDPGVEHDGRRSGPGSGIDDCLAGQLHSSADPSGPSRAMTSTWKVCGNMSTGSISWVVYPDCSSVARSRARVAGLQET